MKIDELIARRLSESPAACPLAPESKDLPLEVRQLIIQRYRILFNVGDLEVYILRIMGPFSGQALEFDSPDAT